MPAEPVASPRYEAEEAVTGFWRVVDRKTGRPAEYRGHMQIGLEYEEARDMAAAMCAQPYKEPSARPK